ncbi:hypothetical protein BDW62DRAFT_103153 [Aspergillus aurantiobrunneus]
MVWITPCRQDKSQNALGMRPLKPENDPLLWFHRMFILMLLLYRQTRRLFLGRFRSDSFVVRDSGLQLSWPRGIHRRFTKRDHESGCSRIKRGREGKSKQRTFSVFPGEFPFSSLDTWQALYQSSSSSYHHDRSPLKEKGPFPRGYLGFPNNNNHCKLAPVDSPCRLVTGSTGPYTKARSVA